MKYITRISLLVTALCAVSSCADSMTALEPSEIDALSAEDAVNSADEGLSDSGGNALPAPPECNPNLRPVVMVHGFLASGDTWSKHAQRFMANGWCYTHLRAFDWNTLDQSTNWSAQLGAFIDGVLEQTGAKAVDLIGHSAGAGLTYSHLSEQAAATKVQRYVYAGAGPQAQPAGPSGDIPTLYLWSKGDTVMQQTGEMPGADTVVLETEDHYSVVSSENSFRAIFAFLNNGNQPATSEPRTGFKTEASGATVAFAENTPTEGDLRIEALDPDTGWPLTDMEPTEVQPGLTGAWGPVAVPHGMPIRYTMVPSDGGRTVHYYREPMTASDPLVYIRTFPTGDGLASLLLSGLPFNASHSIVVVFSASRALDYTADSLKIDGVEVLSQATADPSNTSIAFFFYDQDEDGATSLEPNELFASFPFLAGLDMAIPADGSTMTVQLNDRVLRLPKIASDDAVTVVVFD